MANTLKLEILSHTGQPYNIKPGRISEYENGHREPNLFVLIAYARLGQVHMESVADDCFTLDEFRKRLGKEFCYVTLSPPIKNKRIKPVTLISGTV